MKTSLRIDGISHSYPDGTRSLENVSFSVDEGSRVALLGPNGAGKSTLMLHVNGVIMPQTGTITVGDTVLDSESVRTVRERVGLVFQDPDDQLFMTTVYDDVAFGPANMRLPAADVDRRAHSALHAVGLAEVTSKPGNHLSFGQKKRVALATVLAMEPQVLVLDEPTSNLDPRSRRRMVGLLGGLEQTMLIATHDMELAWELCDRAVVLDAGRLVAEGPARQVMADEGLMLEHGLEVPPSARAGASDVQSRP
jgi:cobalt/nickel transport system ATP-binding protein